MGFLFEMHAHTLKYSSCSEMAPNEYIESARRFKLDGICFTEHDMCWPDEEFKEICVLAGSLVVINAQEVRCWDGAERIQGDFLVYGCKEKFENIDAKSLVKIVHDQGGIIIAAHPYRPGLGCRDLMFELDLDGLEIYNSNNDRNMDYWTDMASRKLGVPLIGGSDAHTPNIVGWGVTEFYDSIENEKGFLDAIRSGRFKPLRRRDILLRK